EPGGWTSRTAMRDVLRWPPGQLSAEAAIPAVGKHAKRLAAAAERMQAV
ncbi:MAG: hypothetical protein QOK20_3473, partial [Acidimicrobiaceae bacterium]|nr:hypothetical protein [Acidimicrobiaceae bacterium]